MYAAPLHLVKITHNQTYVMHREISFCLDLAQSKVKHEVPQRHNYKTSRNDGLHTKPRMSKWRADNTHTAAPTVQQARLLSSPRPQLLQPVGELPERRSNPLQVQRWRANQERGITQPDLHKKRTLPTATYNIHWFRKRGATAAAVTKTDPAPHVSLSVAQHYRCRSSFIALKGLSKCVQRLFDVCQVITPPGYLKFPD